MPDKHAEARVDVSYTKNLGNYESLRVGVSIALPCAPEEIEETTVKAHTLAETYVNDFVREATGKPAAVVKDEPSKPASKKSVDW